ncbi:MAG: 50S ribosomal protein L4 [Verrucomicrobiales bacterium]|jgi:large subunit ribosomal protein L4|nr:50S ribosomal protein L4 [Verrucomicrobiales bacterium]
MAAKTLDIQGAKSANITVVEDGERGRQAVHDVVVAMHANRRAGSANTKTRSEVAATGKKPFRQKGTGRARQGGNASPIHRGGGVAFGPRPRDYSKKVNRATKRLAFSKALTERISEGDVLTIAELSIADGKTKSFVKEISSLTGDVKRTLVIGNDFSEETKRAGRNCQSVLLITAHEVNTEQLLHYSKIIVVEGALETLAARTA